MIKCGRRIIFEKTTGRVIVDFGEMEYSDDCSGREEINELDYVDLEYGYESDTFKRATLYHVNPQTKEVIFDKVAEPVKNPQDQIAQLQ